MIDIQSLFQDGINERVLVIGKTTVNISANQKDVDVLFERDGRRISNPPLKVCRALSGG